MGKIPQSRPLPPPWVGIFNEAVKALNIIISNIFIMDFNSNDFYFELCTQRFNDIHVGMSKYKKTTELLIYNNRILIYKDFLFVKNINFTKKHFDLKIMTPYYYDYLNLKNTK